MKKNKFYLIVNMTAIALLISFAYLPVMSNAAEVWSDNFDDLNCDGWTVYDGAFSCANGYLECTEVATPSTGSTIYHNSSINHGTWSFDVFVVGAWINLVVMNGDWVDYSSFLILEIYTGKIVVSRASGDLAEWVFLNNADGTWTHIDMTVDEEWTINVFVNDTHRINYSTLSIAEPSVRLIFNVDTVGQAIDNVVVDDEIDYEALPFPTSLIPTTETTTTSAETTTTTEPTTTTTPTEPTDFAFPIELLAVGAVVIVIIIIVGFKVKRS